ncbi:MAG: hypothetical protein VX278_14145 [Myxococcota bacterium]|nr:hypothetical protein [Myxococcota bacterium]
MLTLPLYLLLSCSTKNNTTITAATPSKQINDSPLVLSVRKHFNQNLRAKVSISSAEVLVDEQYQTRKFVHLYFSYPAVGDFEIRTIQPGADLRIVDTQKKSYPVVLASGDEGLQFNGLAMPEFNKSSGPNDTDNYSFVLRMEEEIPSGGVAQWDRFVSLEGELILQVMSNRQRMDIPLSAEVLHFAEGGKTLPQKTGTAQTATGEAVNFRWLLGDVEPCPKGSQYTSGVCSPSEDKEAMNPVRQYTLQIDPSWGGVADDMTLISPSGQAVNTELRLNFGMISSTMGGFSKQSRDITFYGVPAEDPFKDHHVRVQYWETDSQVSTSLSSLPLGDVSYFRREAQILDTQGNQVQPTIIAWIKKTIGPLKQEIIEEIYTKDDLTTVTMTRIDKDYRYNISDSKNMSSGSISYDDWTMKDAQFELQMNDGSASFKGYNKPSENGIFMERNIHSSQGEIVGILSGQDVIISKEDFLTGKSENR